MPGHLDTMDFNLDNYTDFILSEMESVIENAHERFFPEEEKSK